MKNIQLQMEIETLRERLIRVANANGFTSPKTIRMSQKLDQLLNEFNQSHEEDLHISY